jgi:hypothetical protein
MRLVIVAVCCLLLARVSAGQATPSAKLPTSTVAGQVVQDTGGMPLKKVVVTLVPSQGISLGGDYQQSVAVTDAEGHFQIDGVQPDDYRVQLDRNGFVPTTRRSHSYSSNSLSVTAGQNVTGLLFRMLPAGVIQGKIVNGDGDPLPGINVFVMSPTHQRSPANGTTNDLGEYRIGDLTAGEYFVMAEITREPALSALKPGEPRVYAPTFYPGTTDRHQATKVQVHPGDETGANFGLISSRVFKVRGNVSGVNGLKSQSGSQLGTATVMLEDDWGGRHFRGSVLPNGTFEISDVLPGSYRAGITAQSGDTWQFTRSSQSIEVRDADVEGVQLSPESESQIHGQFRLDTHSGHIPDWTQLNIQVDPDDRDASDGPVSGKVVKDGSFTLQAPPGNYHVVVTSNSNGESWRDYIMKEVVLNGKDVGDSGFSLASGLTSLEIVASAQGSSIEGNVVDEDGKPVADIPVVCVPDASRRKRHDIYQQVETDRQGHFAMRGLNPGEYQVFTLDDPADDITDPDFVSAHEALSQSVKLDPGERKGVVLKLAPESQP